MQLARIHSSTGSAVGVVADDQVLLLPLDRPGGPQSLADLLHAPDPASLVSSLLADSPGTLPRKQVTFLPPLDHQEVWAAGVTYKRSQEARERESAGAGQFYDLVYNADRPELFFKAPAWRVCATNQEVRIRRDATWSVPEPELALVISPALHIVGYTIGNDMSSRDIEGANPLYLPQAKFYDGSCAVGPVITLASAFPPREQVSIRLLIHRQGQLAFEGSTSLSAMKRTLEELVMWLGKETSFPDGAVLLTGTGIVPPDHFTLARGDEVVIEISGIGQLVNHIG